MADETKLTKLEQIFIIEELARFQTPTQIIKSLKENYEKEVSPQQLNYYVRLCQKKLPNKPTNSTIELQNHFEKSRNEFKKNVESIGGFHQPYRLQILQNELEEELAKKYPLKRTPVIQSLLEQMAKESGGMFTNKRELTGANGAPLIPVEQMASALFKSLIGKGLSEDEAADFSAKRYSVDREKIIRSE